MNGSWDIQQVLVASRQTEFRYEADAVRLAADATCAAAAERTRHQAADERTRRLSLVVPRPAAAATPTGCSGGHDSGEGQAVAA
jgi:hypothetical protein